MMWMRKKNENGNDDVNSRIINRKKKRIIDWRILEDEK